MYDGALDEASKEVHQCVLPYEPPQIANFKLLTAYLWPGLPVLGTRGGGYLVLMLMLDYGSVLFTFLRTGEN
jgi:hypothetical protein